MNNYILLSSLIATGFIGVSGSILSNQDESEYTEKQEFNIEMQGKGKGSYHVPYSLYDPRHIKSKNTLQQVGVEFSDEHIDQLIADVSGNFNQEFKAHEYLEETNKEKNNKTYGYPDNFLHPVFENSKAVISDDLRELKYELSVQYGEHEFKTLQQGQAVTKHLRLRGYDGEMIGPTFIAKPGDTLKIRLNNMLPPEAHRSGCEVHTETCDHATPHAFNTTNLHTHGLHVDPTGNSDNVFIELESGESFDYEIHIPKNHVAGTFWYHAHVHGSTTVQVSSGVHGAIIIRGDYDQVAEIKQAKERVMVLQTIAFDEQGVVEDNENFFVEKWHPLGWSNGWHISVNGQVMPEIAMQPGSTELWRFVHAGAREYMNLRLVSACDSRYDVPLVQLAADGIPFSKKRLADDKGTFIAPGYRSDVMVKPKHRGVYYLIDASVEGSTELSDSYCDQSRDGEDFSLDEKAQNIIARLTVTGPRHSMRLPRNRHLKKLNRPVIINNAELSSDIEYTVFNIAPKEGVDPSDPTQLFGANFKFTINNKTFNPNNARELKLGTAQTWKIKSESFFHPYHIHINPFEVITRDTVGNIKDRYWRDTIFVWPPDEGQDPSEAEVEIRTRYEDFTGSFVMHCHILDHGDRGMMEKITIHE